MVDDMDCSGVVVDDVNGSGACQCSTTRAASERMGPSVLARVVRLQSLDLRRDGRGDCVEPLTEVLGRVVGDGEPDARWSDWLASTGPHGQIPDQVVQNASVVVHAVPQDHAQVAGGERPLNPYHVPITLKLPVAVR